MTIMDRAVIAKESSEPVASRGATTRAEPVGGSFARGFMIAAPLALALWALIFWLI